MGRVFRRTFVTALGLAGATATLGGCKTDPEPPSAQSPSASPSAPASAPRVAAPSGSFSLSVRDLHLNRGGDRPLPTRVWSPTAAGRYPLVLFSHGLTARPTDYTDLITPWARAGFVV